MAQWLGETPRRVVVPLPTPAAGAEIRISPNQLGGWRILSIMWTFVASVVVANRNTIWKLSDGSTEVWRQTTAVVQAASSGQDYEMYPQAVATNGVSGLVTMPLPPDGVYLPRGWLFATTTTNIDVADTYLTPRMLVEEFPDGPDFNTAPSMPTVSYPLDR